MSRTLTCTESQVGHTCGGQTSTVLTRLGSSQGSKAGPRQQGGDFVTLPVINSNTLLHQAARAEERAMAGSAKPPRPA